MRRVPMLLSFVTFVLLGLSALWLHPPAVAQEATPSVNEATMQGVSFESVAFVEGLDLPSPGDLFVARVGFEPGSGFGFEESDPMGGIVVVESGALTIRADAPLTVSRAGSLGAAEATAAATGSYAPVVEEIASGEEVTLETGDSAYIPGGINGEMRNDGDEPAVVLGFLVGPSMGMMAESTPAP